MEVKKKEELTEKELEQVVGGVTRREIARDPRLRKRACDCLEGQNPPQKPPLERHCYTPDEKP